MTNTKRLLMYVVPVTILAFGLNVPKFMEVTLTQHNGTNEVDNRKTVVKNMLTQPPLYSS
jgi:hypothetical protein